MSTKKALLTRSIKNKYNFTLRAFETHKVSYISQAIFTKQKTQKNYCTLY